MNHSPNTCNLSTILNENKLQFQMTYSYKTIRAFSLFNLNLVTNLIKLKYNEIIKNHPASYGHFFIKQLRFFIQNDKS